MNNTLKINNAADLPAPTSTSRFDIRTASPVMIIGRRRSCLSLSNFGGFGPHSRAPELGTLAATPGAQSAGMSIVAPIRSSKNLQNCLQNCSPSNAADVGPVASPL